MVLQLQRLRQVTTQAAGLIGPYRNHEAPGNEKACSCLFAGRQDETQVIESILVYYQQSGSRIASCVAQVPQGLGSTVEPSQNTEELMAYKETFWMACDSTEQLRAEYGPFQSRGEAEQEARKLGFGYLLRYEHIIGENDEIQEVRCIFIELPAPAASLRVNRRLHTRCATCGESAVHDQGWQAEVWADIHEFEHSRHMVRLFAHTVGDGLKEIADWRSAA